MRQGDNSLPPEGRRPRPSRLAVPDDRDNSQPAPEPDLEVEAGDAWEVGDAAAALDEALGLIDSRAGSGLLTEGQRNVLGVYRLLACRYHAAADPLVQDVAGSVRRLLAEWETPPVVDTATGPSLAGASSAELLKLCRAEEAGSSAPRRALRLVAAGVVMATRAGDCATWLADFLATYAFPLCEIVAAAQRAGFCPQDVQEARVLLRKRGLRDGLTGDTPRHWCGFGSPFDWDLRPA